MGPIASREHGEIVRSHNREIIRADIALGLQYLHEHRSQIIHGDLKGVCLNTRSAGALLMNLYSQRNVLIDGEGRASICDFGLSIILDQGPMGYMSSNFGGTL
ncbi:hypothetical protein BS47DRAFT_1489802 [Hydnum rufescens UP504]|uniref:Protein kinase domain-containing protein n=1 Tax=Hydnum rufescens UP504 TaxID=1448309 RepID=A0A9P6DL37_9AGAM|nr:hypothetical protein BS47DRAFT_1489802 [Hydnum rufescens UP504]